jgi:acetyl esterase/lipase
MMVMFLKNFAFFLFVFCCSPGLISAQQPKVVTYKSCDHFSLSLSIFYPEASNQIHPAIVFFHGGGWNGGDTLQFQHHAKYFASRGMVSILANYRVKSRNNTTPFEAVKDAKSAIRFLRKNASDFRIDPEKIVAAGGSAGGHLAAAAGNISGLEEDWKDISISSKPNVLVLFNPVIDNGPGGFGQDVIGQRYPEISPLHNINEGAPATLIFLGTEDKFIPVRAVEEYKRRMEAVGSQCDLFLYEGQGHGFFNHQFTQNYQETVYQTDKFLESLGYLTGKPSIQDTPIKSL